MKNESKFYHEIKKNISQISWIRIENNSLFGTPDLLALNVGYKSRALAQGYEEIKKVLCSL